MLGHAGLTTGSTRSLRISLSHHIITLTLPAMAMLAHAFVAVACAIERDAQHTPFGT
jgi:hypothetical protein